MFDKLIFDILLKFIYNVDKHIWKNKNVVAPRKQYDN